MTFDQAKTLGEWVPIRDCPGRFVLRGVSPALSAASLLGGGVQTQSFRSPVARDTVFVACFEGGGTLSYLRDDGTWLHTLCTEEGLRRKLDQLRIVLSSSPA